MGKANRARTSAPKAKVPTAPELARAELIRMGCEEHVLDQLLTIAGQSFETMRSRRKPLAKSEARSKTMAKMVGRLARAIEVLQGHRDKLANLDCGLEEDLLLSDLNDALPFLSTGLERLWPYEYLYENPEHLKLDLSLPTTQWDIPEMLVQYVKHKTASEHFQLVAALLTRASGQTYTGESLRKHIRRRQAERRRQEALQAKMANLDSLD